MIVISAKVVLKIIQIIKAAYDNLLDEETKRYVIIMLMVLSMFSILLPSAFIAYVKKHPIRTLRMTLSTLSSNFYESIKDVFEGDTEIVIDPEHIAPMGEEQFNKLLDEAKKHVGKPYIWGKDKDDPSKGFNAGGYVCYVYSNSGIKNMPKKDPQGIFDNYVNLISKDDAKAGDIVFFKGTSVSKNTVTHVGIYLGNDYMLHAGDPIGYTNINTNYWQSHLYAFGRPVN